MNRTSSRTAIAAIIVAALCSALLAGCSSTPSTDTTPAQPGAQAPSGIAVPNPTAPADAAQDAVGQMNGQTQQTQQGVQDADPNGLTTKQ
jgi:hypothetical protein